jgi:hypothetical protein
MTVADLNAPVTALLTAANAASPEPARRLIQDRVHPSSGVHLVMAESLLRAWKAPAVVSTVEIDGSTGTVMNAENTAIDSLTHNATAIEWTQTDQSLPMPLETNDESISLALRYSDFMDALNREVLKVSGLPRGRYNLRIDGGDVGAFESLELAQGINLAARTTPMSKQAQTVLDLTYRRNHLRFARMRMVDDALKEYHPVKLNAAIEAMKSLEVEVLALERAAALPKPHNYRLEALPAEKTTAELEHRSDRKRL